MSDHQDEREHGISDSRKLPERNSTHEQELATGDPTAWVVDLRVTRGRWRCVDDSVAKMISMHPQSCIYQYDLDMRRLFLCSSSSECSLDLYAAPNYSGHEHRHCASSSVCFGRRAFALHAN